MDRLSRIIFAFFSLIAVMNGLIDYWTLSKVVPLTGARVHIRSLRGASPTIPVLGENSSYVAESLLSERPVRTGQEKFPCEFLEITASGAVCDGYRLGFPEVDIQDVLDGNSHLPHTSIPVFIPEKRVGATIYRNITLELRWEPATPEFLQIYLKEYLPYWGGRIPYRLLWDAQYESCHRACSSFSDAGEFLPEDVDGLSPSLAADVNFNGVPAAFWNMNINP